MRNHRIPTQPKISEKLFQGQVKKAAILNGFLVYHTWNSFRSDPGFPDMCMVNSKKKRLIFAELKSETGKLTDKQFNWIDELQKVAYPDGPLMPEVYIWKPSDIDAIWEILRK